jgi:GNAT superfamily N-acetyltransferase
MFERNPYAHEPLIYLALDAGKVVGMRAFHGATWQASKGGQTQSCPCACGGIVHPHFRNRGLYRRLSLFALRDLERCGYGLTFTWSASPVTSQAALTLGWRSITPYRPLARVSRMGALRECVSAAMRGRTFFWRFADTPFPGTAGRTFRALDRAPYSPELKVFRRPPVNQMAEVIRQFARPEGLRHCKDAVYLAWRYQNPTRDYRFLLWEDAGTVVGYLVLSTKPADPSPKVAAVDWETRDHAVLARLLGAAATLGRFASLSVWSATLDDHVKETLLNLGFAAMDDTRGITEFRPGPLVRALGPVGAERWELVGVDVLDAANWDLRMIYSDGF